MYKVDTLKYSCVMALPARPHVFLGIFAVIQIKFTLQELPSSGKSLINFFGGFFFFFFIQWSKYAIRVTYSYLL